MKGLSRLLMGGANVPVNVMLMDAGRGSGMLLHLIEKILTRQAEMPAV